MTATETYAPDLFSQEACARATDPSTSHEAATSAHCAIARGHLRHAALVAYTLLGPATDEEVAIHLNVDRVKVTRRTSELRTAGLIERLDFTRPTLSGCPSMVCRVTQAGLDALGAVAA